ncbi:MAG: hypothetical protein ACREM9_06620 [Gemmatimonadales bacterium]
MRLHRSVIFSLLAAAPPIAAQMPAGSPGWHLGGGVESIRFAHVAVSQAAPGVAAEVRPSARPGVHVAVGRAVGPWALELEAGWAGGHVEVGNDAVSVQDRRSDVSRYRLALGIGRRIAAAGSGVVEVGLAPTLDLWSVEGDGRPRAGAEARLTLRVPIGAVELENRLSAGLSGNPIVQEDVGEVSDLRGLRTLSVGIGLRFGI